MVDALVLLGFAAGWGLLLALSVVFTDHPQRWAAVPAAAMGVGGVALLVFTPSNAVMDALGWVWPPALLGLLVWITVQIRRHCRAEAAGGCFTRFRDGVQRGSVRPAFC